jgi:sodium transport system permease protein
MRPWQVVFQKEFREVFRDSRTRFNVIISPLLLVPLILGGIMSMGQRQAEKASKEKIAVAAVGLNAAPELQNVLRGSEADKMNQIKIEPMTRDAAEEAVRKRRVRAAFVVPADADAMLRDMRPVRLTLLLDKGSQTSREGAERLKAFLTQRGNNVVGVRLLENGLSQELNAPFRVTEEGVKGGSNQGTLLLSLFLPYMLSLWAITGGIYVANDTVAGEKERGTLETLLVSAVPRRQLVLGKFLAVAGVALVSSVLSIVGFIWPFYVKLPFFRTMSESGLSLQPAAIAAMFLVQVPLAILGAGVLMTISTFARNQKEAQTFLGPVLLGVTVAAMMTMLLRADAPLFWALVPITNAALVLKQALEGVTNLPFVAVACVASLAYAAAAVLFATRSFQKESILLKA